MEADEEAAWIAEKQQLLADRTNVETLAGIQVTYLGLVASGRV